MVLRISIFFSPVEVDYNVNLAFPEGFTGTGTIASRCEAMSPLL